jgi:hypothetical protein
MNTAIASGDVFIRPFVGEGFQLVDAATYEQIAIVPSIQTAIAIAAQRGGTLWHENADDRGHALGPPILLPSGSVEVPTRPAPHITARRVQLQQLEALRQKWTADLQRLLGVDTDQAMHLAEALDDLAVVIGRLEN